MAAEDPTDALPGDGHPGSGERLVLSGLRALLPWHFPGALWAPAAYCSSPDNRDCRLGERRLTFRSEPSVLYLQWSDPASASA